MPILVVNPNFDNQTIFNPTDPYYQRNRIDARQVQRFNYNEKFDRPVFTGRKKVIRRNKRIGWAILDTRRRTVFSEIVRDRGGMEENFIKDNNFTVNS